MAHVIALQLEGCCGSQALWPLTAARTVFLVQSALPVTAAVGGRVILLLTSVLRLGLRAPRLFLRLRSGGSPLYS